VAKKVHRSDQPDLKPVETSPANRRVVSGIPISSNTPCWQFFKINNSAPKLVVFDWLEG
jgi:hypothetical protein